MLDFARQAQPGRQVIGVREAKFHRWLIAAPGVRVDVTVRRAGPGLLAVTLGDYARGVVEVADGFPADVPEVWTHDPATERPPAISAARMYDEHLMFHGPLFQGVTALHALGDRHVRATVTAPASPGALLDNALQPIGNWLVTVEPQRAVALPVALNHVRLFGPPHPAGTEFQCVTRIRSLDDAQVVTDVQLSVGGRVWAQIDGAVERRFDSDPAARLAERFPDRHPLSARHAAGWTMVFDRWADPVARGMTAFRVLGTDAFARYERMPPAGRKPWLLGRIAAKDAVRFSQWDAGHAGIYPIELSITNDDTGKPHAHVPPGRGLLDCQVSLAHCAEIGVATAAPIGEPAPGIDVVEITDRAESTLRYALGPAERDLLDRLGGDRMLWFARFWAAKEAVGKALGTGLAGAPRTFVVRDRDLSVVVDGWRYQVRCTEVENPPGLPPRKYVVAWTSGRTPSSES